MQLAWWTQTTGKALCSPVLDWYLKGARLLDDSEVAVVFMATIDNEQRVSDAAVVKNKTNSTTNLDLSAKGTNRFVERQLYGKPN
ncbi:hypothetical protein V6N13_088733 [Hibiscus sabdariffa]